MTEMIAIPQPQYVEMVNFIQNSIRNKFDATDNNEWWTHMHLIEQAKELGCTDEFITEIRKDAGL